MDNKTEKLFNKAIKAAQTHKKSRRAHGMSFRTGSIDGDDIDLDEIAFAVDTAGSWDGGFPDPGRGDYLVEIAGPMGDDEVLVSRRYTGAISAKNAAELALSAYAERNDFETDDEGNLIPQFVPDFEDYGKVIPASVTAVKKVR